MAMLYILDTDHMTLWQHNNAVVIAKLRQVPFSDRAVTQVSLTEQVQGWQALIARARTEGEIARNLQRLYETITLYQSLQVLRYEPDAILRFEQLRQAKIRIGSQDLRIAAIALGKNATVVTRNLRDFRQIPGLQVADWSIPSE